MVVRDMVDVQQRPIGRPPARRPRRFGQPEGTAALRPSQRRAAINRAALRESRSAADWLRRLRRV
jgi:hypothetical protein